jgi:hypothetical protein
LGQRRSVEDLFAGARAHGDTVVLIAFAAVPALLLPRRPAEATEPAEPEPVAGRGVSTVD